MEGKTLLDILLTRCGLVHIMRFPLPRSNVVYEDSVLCQASVSNAVYEENVLCRQASVGNFVYADAESCEDSGTKTRCGVRVCGSEPVKTAQLVRLC